MPKASEFITGMIFTSFIIAIFGLFMAQMNANYGVEYDNESLATYNQLAELHNLTEEIENSSNIARKSGVLDIIGEYFTDGYNVLKITKKSFNTFDVMSNQAIDDANLGEVGAYLRITISAVVLIMIVLAIIVSAIVKRDL